jgi:thiol-disulfide isomerase/thioredoxin
MTGGASWMDRVRGALGGWNMIGAALLLVLFVGVGYSIYAKVVGKPPVFFANREHVKKGAGDGSGVTLYFFTAGWCPACQRVLADKNAFIQNYDGQSVVPGGPVVTCVEMDCTPQPPAPDVEAALQRYSVKGYPCVVGSRAGNATTYQGQITEDNLVAFVKSL